MGRSKRRRGRNRNSSGVINGGKEPQSCTQPLSVSCGICGKQHDDGFPIWRLPCSGRFNVIVQIPACNYCRDPKHFVEFLNLGDKFLGPKTSSDYLNLIVLYLEANNKKRAL